MFDSVNERFVERNEKVGTLRLNQTQFVDALQKVLQHTVHQREVTR
jgi:hypothetical protein